MRVLWTGSLSVNRSVHDVTNCQSSSSARALDDEAPSNIHVNSHTDECLAIEFDTYTSADQGRLPDSRGPQRRWVVVHELNMTFELVENHQPELTRFDSSWGHRVKHGDRSTKRGITSRHRPQVQSDSDHGGAHGFTEHD